MVREVITVCVGQAGIQLGQNALHFVQFTKKKKLEKLILVCL